MKEIRNVYGDSLETRIGAFGADISSQRLDDLDTKAIEYIRNLETHMDITNARVADIGCGVGGFSREAIKTGAMIFAYDIDTSHQQDLVSSGISFTGGDFRNSLKHIVMPYHAILCQRMIHYLNYYDAAYALSLLKNRLLPKGRLFISASGSSSELANEYNLSDSIYSRFSYLSPDMQEKHNIKSPVCLYSKTELCDLLIELGFLIDDSWISEFGNIKVIAKKQ